MIAPVQALRPAPSIGRPHHARRAMAHRWLPRPLNARCGSTAAGASSIPDVGRRGDGMAWGRATVLAIDHQRCPRAPVQSRHPRNPQTQGNCAW
jgi:hypothetical protein